ncbi:MAG: hypothetical protein JXB05_07360 [Myxococcaceae bacterium]|nr:hypothetical protein [Myxococcaceae bacterium]
MVTISLDAKGYRATLTGSLGMKAKNGVELSRSQRSLLHRARERCI